MPFTALKLFKEKKKEPSFHQDIQSCNSKVLSSILGKRMQ